MKLLKKYIKSLILEISQEDVQDSTNPLDWIAAAYEDYRSWHDEDGEKSTDEYWAMFDAAKSFGLTYLGRGSARRVFAIGSDKVVKLAKDKRGLAQNKIEAFAGNDSFASEILAEVYDYDAVDFAWIIAERLTPLEDGEESIAEELIGVPWTDIKKMLGVKDRWRSDARELGVKDDELAPSFTSKAKPNLKFMKNFESFLHRYAGLLEGDIAKTSSWGIKKDGSLAILDYGITKKAFEELY